MVIFLAGYLYLAVETDWPWVKNTAYYQVLDIYGRAAAAQAELQTIANPGLRKVGSAGRRGAHPDPVDAGIRIMDWKELLQGENKAGAGMTIAVITPEAKASDRKLARAVIGKPVDLLVECSRMDKWHTTAEGWRSLARMRAKCLRVVVFDGGHHISTLGTCPDIILVPAVNGYAAHSYIENR